MSATQHVDEQTLIRAATDPSLRIEHIEACPTCQRDLAAWRRIADVARYAVASVPPPSEDLGDRIVASTVTASQKFDMPKGLIRRSRGHEVSRRIPWLIAAMVALLVIVTAAIALSVSSTVPSSASILAKIRDAPSVVASTSKSVSMSLYSTVRTQHGVVVMDWRGKDVYIPPTNAFQLNVTGAYPGQHFATSTTSSDGSLVYLPCNATWEVIGQKPCVAYPAQGGSSASDRFSVSLLRGARGPIARLGQRTIDGVETTGYQLTVPASVYIAGAEPSERSLLGQELATTKSLRMDVWSDSHGLPIELDYALKFRTTTPPALLTETVQSQLRYSSNAPRLEFPSQNDTLVVRSLQAAEQQLNKNAAELEACGGAERCGVDNKG